MKRSKLDIAALMLDRAIWQYFHGDDLAIVHNLAHAANGLLVGLAKTSLGGQHVQGKLFRRLKAKGVVLPGGAVLATESQFVNFINDQANRLKHSDREQDDLEVEHSPVDNALALAVSHAGQLGSLSWIQIIYLVWVAERVGIEGERPFEGTGLRTMFHGIRAIPVEQALEAGAIAVCGMAKAPPGPFACTRHPTPEA